MEQLCKLPFVLLRYSDNRYEKCAFDMCYQCCKSGNSGPAAIHISVVVKRKRRGILWEM